MKIEFQNTLNNYRTPVPEQKKNPTSMQKNERNFDAIKIQGDKSPSAQQRFIDSLTSRLSLEVRQPVPESQILNLQEQIKQGTYTVDSNAIADRIMLY